MPLMQSECSVYERRNNIERSRRDEKRSPANTA